MSDETKTPKIDVKAMFEKLSWRDIRNAAFGLIVVFGGLGLAGVTLWAHQTGNPRLAGAAAVASLVFVVLILLFVVPPLARSASKEVSQIDLPIEITTGGLIFLGIVAIVAFAAWNTGNNLLFLVLSFLLATLVVSFVMGGTNLKKLEAKVRFPEAIFAAEPTAFSVGLKNRKFLFPTFSVALALRGSMTDDPFGGREFVVKPPEALARFLRLPWLRRTVGYFIHVPRRAEADQQTEQLFPARGRFIIKDFELSTKFPFGFWQRRRRLKVKETDIFIFPQLTNLNEFAPALAKQNGQHASTRRGAGQDLLGLRDYQPADDRRFVDWKATARTGNLTVREYAAENERRVTVAFDSHLPIEKKDAEAEARFERGVSLAATLIDYYIGEGANVRLAVDGQGGNFANDKVHFYESLRRLSLVEPKLEVEKEQQTIDLRDSDFTILVTSSPQDFSSSGMQLISY
jgi:uncharacterized protein (DUF58 family)